MSATADGHLGHLLAALVEGQPLPAATHEWLALGVLAAIRTDAPLDTALGLHTGPGRHARLRRRLAQAARDQHLREAARHCVLDASISAWERAGRLAHEVATFHRLWRAGRPPAFDPGWSTCRQHLHAAAQAGDLPTSQRQLHDLLRQTPHCLPREGVGILARYGHFHPTHPHRRRD